MTAQMLIENTLETTTSKITYLYPEQQKALHIVPAEVEDVDAVVALFGALHSYNSSLDSHFDLSDEWEAILRQQFVDTCDDPNMRWLLVKDGAQVCGLLIAGVHTDSPMFRHRQWVEVQALYVADTHRRMGIARLLLNEAYAWAEALNLPRVQLYVTASNVRAQSVYEEEGFATSQAIMRKKL
jgi:ribosomal protein S18 acetylase RimI-like enzyme